jgi:hypothetical protein
MLEASERSLSSRYVHRLDCRLCLNARVQTRGKRARLRGVADQESRRGQPPRCCRGSIGQCSSHFVIAAGALRGQLADMPPDEPVRLLEIAEPCPAAWDAMSGSGAARHCGECGKTVHHLSAMDPAAAAELLAGPGAICVRLRCDSDGLVLHDAPRSAQRRLRLLTPAVVAAMAACAFPTDGDSSLLEGAGAQGAPPRAIVHGSGIAVMGLVAAGSQGPFGACTPVQTFEKDYIRSPGYDANGCTVSARLNGVEAFWSAGASATCEPPEAWETRYVSRDGYNGAGCTMRQRMKEVPGFWEPSTR